MRSKRGASTRRDSAWLARREARKTPPIPAPPRGRQVRGGGRQKLQKPLEKIPLCPSEPKESPRWETRGGDPCICSQARPLRRRNTAQQQGLHLRLRRAQARPNASTRTEALGGAQLGAANGLPGKWWEASFTGAAPAFDHLSVGTQSRLPIWKVVLSTKPTASFSQSSTA